ncbi:Exocyst complex component 8 [Intoshia linei]|uniref:Exocyst complex component 8 n=1 Tax=Intoshia linei TaxID=1819745 RepID=A0A177BCH1_9BILA|nr:Exocyst complex component 8 [Intoshia linei]
MNEINSVVSKDGFDPTEFVTKLAISGVSSVQGFLDLLKENSEKNKLHLKKNIYQNFDLFIDGVKDVSEMESILYNLSHKLYDQKKLLDDISSLLFEKKPLKKETIKKERLPLIVDQICNLPKKSIFDYNKIESEADFVELKNINFIPIRKIHAILLIDCIVILTRNTTSKNKKMYCFEECLELQSLTVFNVTDSNVTNNTIRIIKNEDNKIYQCPNSDVKSLWINKINTLRKNLLKKSNVNLNFNHPNSNQPEELIQNEKNDVYFSDIDGNNFQTIVNFLQNIDVIIAHKKYKEAVDIVLSVTDILQKSNKIPLMVEHENKIELVKNQIIKQLSAEAFFSPERWSRAGTEKDSIQAIILLCRLKRSSLAASLFLRARSTQIDYNLNIIKIEISFKVHVENLVKMFCSNMELYFHDYMNLFKKDYPCLVSDFIVWTQEQLMYFVYRFSNYVLTIKSPYPLEVIVSLVVNLRNRVENFQIFGLNVIHIFDEIMAQPLSNFINCTNRVNLEKFNVLSSKIKRNCFKSEKNKIRFENILNKFGIKLKTDYFLTHKDVFSTYLTEYIISLLKIYIDMVNLSIKTYNLSIHSHLKHNLNLIYNRFVSYLRRLFREYEKSNQEVQKIIKINCTFFISQLQPAVNRILLYNINYSLIDETNLDNIKDFFEIK